MSNPERSETPSGRGAETEKPVPDESARTKAKEMMKAYEDRPTAVLPGSDNTVAGTAVSEWLDEEGQPIYGRNDDAGNSS